jgi:hypothetical protein
MFLLLEATQQYKVWRNGEKLELDGEKRLTRCFDRKKERKKERKKGKIKL